MENNPLTSCPCCKRLVNRVEARSIFNFKIKICKTCASHEKDNPEFKSSDLGGRISLGRRI